MRYEIYLTGGKANLWQYLCTCFAATANKLYFFKQCSILCFPVMS